MIKKILFISLLLFGISVFAQAPQKMSYQSVVRTPEGKLVKKSSVKVRISLLKGSEDGTRVYGEVHYKSTNDNGLVSFKIGEGTQQMGQISTIDWSKGPYFIKAETDPAGGNDYPIEVITELMSVPYALYAANSPVGPQGEMGPQGPAGPKGQTGGNGPVGPPGSTGATGPAGSQGIQGIPGVAGSQGNQGIQGIPGIQGAAGVNGTNGISAYQVWLANGGSGTETDFINFLKGEQGIQGIQGVAGPIGPQGMVGPTGPEGLQGIPGIAGPVGPVGTTGAAGIDGTNGTNGNSAYQIWLNNGGSGTETDFITFLKGVQGIQGIQGIAGPQGVEGPVGSLGAVGPAGTNGTNGMSAYQVWLDNGGIGTEADFINALKGAQGTQGVAGPIGPVGSQGNQGQQGNQGDIGLSAYEIWLANGGSGNETAFINFLKGAAGPTGAIGLQGTQGLQGIQGPVGLLPNATQTGATPYWNGSTWVTNSGNIYNNGGSVGVGTLTPATSAKLEVNSTTQGFLPPRMTAAQRDAITSPVPGLVIWCNNCGANGEMQVHNTTEWTNVVGNPVSAPLAIGDSYQGGKIGYILQPGDPGYNPSILHGIIIATSDYGPALWGCSGNLIGTPSQTIGSGQANTAAIVNGCAESGIIAKICDDLVLNGYSDWYLPSLNELIKLFMNSTAIGGILEDVYYYSSSELGLQMVKVVSTTSLSGNNSFNKNVPLKFRPVRSF